MTDVATPNQRRILSKWRNAVSILMNEETGEITVNRFIKKEERWKQILYFRTQEDFDDFIDWLDEVSGDDD